MTALVAGLEERRTARMLLRRPHRGDLADIAAMHLDPEVMATLGGVRDHDKSVEFLDGLLDHWQRHGFGVWIARDLQSDRFAGRGGLHRVTIDGQGEVEIAYGFISQFWGLGLATELARESIRVAFGELQLDNLVCFTLPTNRRSQHVMEKVGFTYEKDITHFNLPHVLYRLRA